MRESIYKVWGMLPFKIGSGAAWLAGLVSALRPDEFREATGAAMSAEHFQQVGIVFLALSSVYFFVLWLLKPGAVPEKSGQVSISGGTHHHIYGTLQERLVVSADAHSNLTHPGNVDAHIGGRMAAAEEDDTLDATGVLGLSGLYIGYIIVAAGHMKSKHYLEFAIVGFNGAPVVFHISDVTGRIRAGVGNLGDGAALPTPLFQGVLNAEPGKEFVLQMRQDVSAEQAEEYLTALDDGGTVSLDLRELNIVVSSVTNPQKRARLPLWDGVNLRRRDDIVSNRNTIASLGMAVETTVSLGLVVARVDGTTEHPDV